MPRPTDGPLARFTRDLTAEARDGRLEPVRCRTDEIARVIDILLRHGKNNPALVGPAGVGKTAIAEGLAQRLVSGDVPLSLRDARILALDHVALLAGTTYRGQYEERIRVIVEATSADPDVVLFIDELHNLIGQGTAMGVAMDAANMLKPALVRGDFRVIGATTDEEYDRWICGDPALERRFQKVIVRELSPEETLEIIEARKDRLERHHNVLISPEALRAAVELTDRYMTDRTRPDRAIDALDEACAHTHAVAQYTERAETLIARRRRLLRERARAATANGARPEERRADPEPALDTDTDDPDAVDPLDRMAKNGMAALERFGAELEAMLNGTNAPRAEPADAPRATVEREPAREARTNGRRESLATLDAEIAALLLDEGIVVRGADVARVVGLSTGQLVPWIA